MSIRDRSILLHLDIERDDGRYQIGLCDGGQRYCCSPAGGHRRRAVIAQGSASVSDDGNVQGWVVMLVPFSFIDGKDEATGKPLITAEPHLRRTVVMSDAHAAERRTFYQSLLKYHGSRPCSAASIMLSWAFRCANKDATSKKT